MKKLEIVIPLTILLIAAFFRFYKIDGYMSFLGDEGRDALIVREIAEGRHYPLLGPPTSVGNIYLGPLYYYMMAIPFALSNSNPASAAVMVALIGVATVGVIYYLTRAWFGITSGILAALLYAISPVTIVLSHSSWNPNPAPFFALLTILGFYASRIKRNYLWLALCGVSLAFALQMHYLALILLPFSLLILLYEVKTKEKRFLKEKHFVLFTLLGLALFIALMSPLYFFDVRHDFMNARAILTFFVDRQTTVNLNIVNTLSRVPGIYFNDLVGRYMAAETGALAVVVGVIILVPLFKKRPYWPYFVLGVWLIVGVLGLSLYKQSIFDHYLGFLNPAPYILFGSIVYSINKLKKALFRKALLVIFFMLTSGLILVNLNVNPLRKSPNYQLKRTQDISRFIIGKAGNKQFNFALISAHNYDSAYQYYLEVFNHKPAQLPFVITDQLFVVCEDQVCEPINHPKYEIAAFGWAKIEQEAIFEGVKVFKLVHNK